MSLSARLTLMLAGVLAAGALVSNWLQRKNLERQFGAVEWQEASTTALLARRAIESVAQDVAHGALHIAWSDRLHAALGHANAALENESPAPAILAASNLDVVAILDVDGRVRFLHVSHPDRPAVDTLEMLPAASVDLTQLFGPALEAPGVTEDRGVLASGLVVTEVGPLLIAARNLVPATRSAERHGIVVVGRFLGSALDRELEERLGFGMNVLPVGTSALPPEVALHQQRATASPAPVVVAVDDERLDVYSTLDDVRGRPELLLRTVLRRDIAAAADVAIASGLPTTVGVSLVLLSALIVALRALALRPLAALTRSAARIGESEDYSLRIEEARADELGALARQFNRVLERLDEAHRQVAETSRAAGMTEIARGILHNVGNVLNSVNISTSILSERVQGMCVDDLAEIAEVLRQKGDDLAPFLTQDPQGKHLQPFLCALVDQLSSDRNEIAQEIESLSTGLEHVCKLVKSQQGLARSSQALELVAVERLLADAVNMTAGARAGNALAVEIDLEAGLPPLLIDRNKALEIIVNLLQNARQSIEEFGPRPGGHRLLVRARHIFGEKLRLEVSDTGVGIDKHLLTQIFQLGFTTKSKGSGLGLHTAANSSRSLGGSLSAESPGRGHGATFVLELPFAARNAKVAA